MPFAALVGLHVVQGPEGHNDPSSPVPERSSGALVKAGAYAAVVFSVFGGLLSPAAWRTDRPRPFSLVLGGCWPFVSLTFVLRRWRGARPLVRLKPVKDQSQPRGAVAAR